MVTSSTPCSSDTALEGSATPLASVSPTFATSPVDDVAAPAITSGGRRKSIAWLHFCEAQDYKTSRKATCMRCGTTLTASHGSTSTMLNHLRMKHADCLAGPSDEKPPDR
jgi:BED zinc finger